MSIRSLPKELQEKAIIELGEVPNRIQEDVKQIREWIQKQPHLKIKNGKNLLYIFSIVVDFNIILDDQWILSFLRACKFSLQRTKEKLDLYYTLRSLSPELFPKENPITPNMQAYFKYR